MGMSHSLFTDKDPRGRPGFGSNDNSVISAKLFSSIIHKQVHEPICNTYIVLAKGIVFSRAYTVTSYYNIKAVWKRGSSWF